MGQDLFLVRPEVAGGFGPNTVMSTPANGGQPVVGFLEYCFDDWQGDEILTSSPCYIVTESLAKDLEKSKVTGISFTDVQISKSELFHQIHANGKLLPTFRRLLMQGTATIVDDEVIRWTGHDVCSASSQLVATNGFLNVLKRHHASHCNIHRLRVKNGIIDGDANETSTPEI